MFGKRLSALTTRLKHSLVALLFVSTQVVFPLGLSGAFVGHAAAAQSCTSDSAGANDQPGQKDLTKFCLDDAGLANNPKTVDVSWNWDDTGTSGSGQSLDACSLFDNNGNGNIDYAVCVTTTGDPATQAAGSPAIYSCGDTKVDRCTSPSTLINGPYSTTCTVSQSQTNPFDSSFDTKADCTLYLSEAGGNATKLVDVCSYPSQSPTSDPSDCIILQPKSGKLEVIKHLLPAGDSGKFNLQIDGTTKATDVGDTGTTGEVVVSAANHSVGELAGTNTSLSSYNSTIECKDQNGTGNVVASTTGNGTSLTGVPVADGSDIVCVITNTHQSGTITLNKVVTKDNGGTAGVNDFGLSIGGTSVTSGQTLTLNPGNYAINEAGKTGYQFVSITGDAACPAVLGGNVTLADNQNVTCTITNDDIAPQLTVIKHVINNNGGTAVAGDFTMNVTGNNVSPSSSFAGAESPGTTVTLNAGSYSVDESAFTGYTKTLGADCSGTIALGEHKTCTITNDDNAPLLTLVKHVTNDNGGSNTADQWTLKAQHANDTPIINATGTPSNGGTVATTSAATATANTSYALSESGPSGYSPSTWNCNGGVLSNGSVTLGVGENVTCTITNDDIAPQLTVTKVVTNNDGGTLKVSDFPLFVGSVQVVSGTTYTSFNAGTYTVSETQQSGYNLDSITGDCLANGSLTMVVGGVYSCTLTNNDIPATITVTKVVHNNHGGKAIAGDFNLFVGATQVTNGVSNTFAANQQYTVSEVAQVNGYQQDSLVCTDTNTGANLGATFTPTLAEQIACTITNSDIAPQLTVIKHVVNNSGGTAVASDFTMDISGTNIAPSSSFAGAESPGTTVTLDAGSYSVDESGGPSGYAKTIGQNCSGTIALGATLTCVITNTDIAPTITVNKTINPSNDTGKFDLSINGPTNSTTTNQGDGGTTGSVNVTNGTYTVSETATVGTGTDLSDYTSSYDCDNGTTGSGTTSTSFTVGSGDSVSCTFTNVRLGSVTIVKDAQPNDLTQSFDFTGDLGQFSLIDDGLTPSDGLNSKLFDKLSVGTYTVTEPSGLKGWSLDSVTCVGGSDAKGDQRDAVIKLQPGENVTCTFVNKAVPPTLTVIKHVVNANGNNAAAADFTMHVTNTASANDANFPGDENGTTVTMNNGAYTVTEDNLPGYTASFSSDCTGTLALGDTPTCTVTNTANAPALTISKTNNRPDPTVVGDTVTYTIVVTAPTTGGTVFDASVTDLPPDNFTYVLGSWTSVLTDTDNSTTDLKANNTTTEPSYGSPGIWNLGTLKPGQKITLTYQAKIGSNVSNGTYPDLAFTQGCNIPSTLHLCVGGSKVTGSSTLNSATAFVGTKVTIAAAIKPTNFAAGQVLGASILVNTGTNLLSAQYILPVILVIGLYITRRMTEEKGGK